MLMLTYLFIHVAVSVLLLLAESTKPLKKGNGIVHHVFCKIIERIGAQRKCIAPSLAEKLENCFQ